MNAASVVAVLAVALGLLPWIATDGLTPRLRDDRLSVSAPGLDVMPPPLLGRLKDGGTVSYDFHLSLAAGSPSGLRRRAFERFAVSYDLWEEKFAVTVLGRANVRASNLGRQSVVPWCLENISIASPGVRELEQHWVRLEVRAVDSRRDSPFSDREGISLSVVIDALSRPARQGEHRWSLQAGPLTVAELRGEPAR